MCNWVQTKDLLQKAQVLQHHYSRFIVLLSSAGHELQAQSAFILAYPAACAIPQEESASSCRQLTSASSDSSDWVSKYHKAEDGRSTAVAQKDSLERDLRAQLAQAEQRATQAETRLSQAEQQASTAEATLARERQSWEQRLQEAQAQATAAPAANNSAMPGESQARIGTVLHNCTRYCLYAGEHLGMSTGICRSQSDLLESCNESYNTLRPACQFWTGNSGRCWCRV